MSERTKFYLQKEILIKVLYESCLYKLSIIQPDDIKTVFDTIYDKNWTCFDIYQHLYHIVISKHM